MPANQTRAIRVKSIEISDVGCFRTLRTDFSDRFNLICGANGVGKSTLLALIGRAFSYHQSDIRRRAAAEAAGEWTVVVQAGADVHQVRSVVTGLVPADPHGDAGQNIKAANHLLYFKANRDFLYESLQAIAKDPALQEHNWSMMALQGLSHTDIKRWFANRYLFSAHPGNLSEAQIVDFEFAKKCFSILDPRISFDRVDTSSFDIYVSTPQGTIPFEYLSSGFRASLALLLGITREIEVRQFQVAAEKFNGVILIDELDLHLHPTWQRLIVGALKTAFSEAQFIVTTHSPHMIQDAEPGEVLALLTDKAGTPHMGEFQVGKYGFKGWTLEEILRDVMRLDNVETDTYRNAIREFDKAVDAEDADRASIWLGDLEMMLHPQNHLRKLLRLQAAPKAAKEDD